MVYCDNYMSVRISAIAEVAHNGQDILFLTHLSGAKNQTKYQTSAELLGAYRTVQAMLVHQETGKSIEEHEADGTIQKALAGEGAQGAEAGLSLVKPSE